MLAKSGYHSTFCSWGFHSDESYGNTCAVDQHEHIIQFRFFEVDRRNHTNRRRLFRALPVRKVQEVVGGRRRSRPAVGCLPYLVVLNSQRSLNTPEGLKTTLANSRKRVFNDRFCIGRKRNAGFPHSSPHDDVNSVHRNDDNFVASLDDR